MTLIVHSPESLALASRRVFEAALPVAREGGAAGLVVVVVDAADRVHYHTSRTPTMTAGMLSSDLASPPVFDEDRLGDVAGQAYAAALTVADEHCVGFALVVVDADERVRIRSSMGLVMTAGMLRRTSVLFDITSMLPTFVPFAAVGGGHPGGGGPQPAATTGTGGNAAAETPVEHGTLRVEFPTGAAASPPAPSDESN